MAKFYFFLDETGDHGLTYVDKNFPLFLLCGCLFSENDLSEIEGKINCFKNKYFKTTSVILHSREIRKCEGAFQILFNLELKKNFYDDLNLILGEAKYTIIASGINKEEYIKKYGKGAKDPYLISLSFIIERLIFYLDTFNKGAIAEIKLEIRGRKEDKMLAAHLNMIMDRGTYYISPERLKEKIKGFEFFAKRENILGLQIADLTAYPLARHILRPEEPYIPFKIIEKKIYCDKNGKYDGWGLKIFP